MNILVAGDERIIAIDIRHVLEQLGYTVVGMAPSAAELLDQLRAEQPQLVLLDLQLPGAADGLALADQIDTTFDTPVLLLIPADDHAAQAQVEQAALVAVVVPPLEGRTLQRAIELAVARHAMERRLRASELRFSAMLDSIGEAVLAIDAHHELTFLNPAAEQLTGWPALRALGQRLAVVVRVLDPRTSQPTDLPVAQVLETGVTAAFDDVLLVGTGGAHIPVGGTIAPLHNEAGALGGAVLVLRDFTERRQAEQQQLAFESKLLEKQKMESLGVLAGGIAHDFNNLLATIMGNAELALFDLEPDSPVYGPVTVLISAARRAAELTRQLLVYSGRAKVLAQPHNLNHLVQEMTGLLRASFPKTIQLETRLDPAVPSIETDVAQIRQVIMNLATNAAEAIGMQEGTITISTGLRQLAPGDLADAPLAPDQPTDSYISLEVADNGAGMDAATQARIFDPFFSTKFVGRGLGLAAVLGIVRGHGGALLVASNPGRGSTFTVLLPCPVAVVDDDLPDLDELPDWPTGGKVLVIDDDVDVCQVVSQILGRYGFETLSATDGTTGFALFRQHRAEIVCVLLDLTMPQPTGDQVLEMIRQVAPATRVVLMSGYSREEAVGRIRSERLAGFLQKPFSALELSASVQAVLRQA